MFGKIIYSMRVWKEKKIYLFWAAFSTLQIECESVVPILSIKVGMKRSSFYAVYSSEVKAEALEFKKAVDYLAELVYDNNEKEVEVFIVHQSGYKHKFKITKTRKRSKYEDYRRLAFLIRYIIVCSSTKRWERKFVKQATKYYLKDRKEIEKYEEFCF